MSDNTLSIAASVGNLSPADILAENNVKLLVAYAISSKADPDILAILAAHDSVAVREAVAENAKTSQEALSHLAETERFRDKVARNTNASPETLARILSVEQRGSEAFNNALANKNTPLEVIMQTILESASSSSAIALKSNERFSELMKLAKKIDSQTPSPLVDETIYESDASDRWR